MTDEDFLECEEGEDDFVIKHNIVANKAIAKAKMELSWEKSKKSCSTILTCR